jgi:hypothetical protein
MRFPLLFFIAFSLHYSQRPSDTGYLEFFKGLLIFADDLAAAAHARFTLHYCFSLYYCFLYILYTPPGGRQTRALRELKSLHQKFPFFSAAATHLRFSLLVVDDVLFLAVAARLRFTLP